MTTTPPRPGVLHPRVTALVPTYNGAAFIQRTLDSLAAQTWPNLEILIGDDCSTDETLALVTSFAAGRDDTRVIARTQNLGWLGNSNDLMSRASGEFMFFAFHDDAVTSDYIERLATALQRDPRAVLAFSDMTVTEVDGTQRRHEFDGVSTKRTAVGRGLAMAMRPRGWWVPNRGLFRRSAYLRIGGIHRNDCGEYSADWTWLLHLALLGRFVRVDATLCHKFYTSGSLSKTWPHDETQRAALLRAGIAEVRGSSIPIPQKLVVLVPLLGSLYGTPWMRTFARRVVGLP